MQDRFKFRVWNKKVKKMYDVKSMSYIDGVIKRIEVQGDIGIAIFDEYGKHIDNCILMQCTGLKDKNGKLIYENDIVADVLTNKFIINFDEKYLSFLLTNIKTKESMVFYPNIKLEIIGNIYENPLDTTKN